MTCKKEAKKALLFPDEAGIIRAERLPKSADCCTIRDMREELFNSALYVEQCAREYIDNPPPRIDTVYLDAMQSLIDAGGYLRSLVDDEEINNVPFSLAGKIWGLAISAMFIGKMDQLANVAPILGKEQITREIYARMQEYHRETLDKIDQKDKAAARQPKLTQEEAAKAILRAQGKRPTETAIDSTKRKIRLWEAYTQGKGGNKPPEGYPGLHVSALDFSQWAAQVQRNKAAKRALHGLVRIQKDPSADDEQTTRAELAALAETAKIEAVKKALDTFDN